MVFYYAKVPPQILEAKNHVTLAADIFFVNQVPLFATVSNHIKFATNDSILSRKAVQIVKAAKNVNNIYRARGFHVHAALMEGEFSPLKGDLGREVIQVNLTAANERVPKIERRIRVIK